MLARVLSCATVGLDGLLVEVEVDVGNGPPGLFIVGLPDAAIQESKERVKAAIRNAGARFPHGHVTVNLAPADVRKEGPAYDLPIAVGILVASGQVDADLADAIVVGELGLDGAVRHINGILPMVSLARATGLRRAFVPKDDAPEAALVAGVEVLPIGGLADLLAHLEGARPIAPHRADEGAFPLEEEAPGGVDLAHVKGQEQVKRGLEVAAAGGHNLLRFGIRRPFPRPAPPRAGASL